MLAAIIGLPTKIPVQTSEGSNLTSDSTHVGPGQTSDYIVHTSDWDKRRTVQMWDQYKRYTSTKVGPREKKLFEF